MFFLSACTARNSCGIVMIDSMRADVGADPLTLDLVKQHISHFGFY